MPFNTYIDESERSNYLLVGVNVPHPQIHPIRQVMRDLRTADSLHIHMYRESRGRQKYIAQTITSLQITSWIISVSSQTARDPIARNLALQNIGHLESMRDSRLITLDYINRHRADNSILREIAQNSDFQFPSLPPHELPARTAAVAARHNRLVLRPRRHLARCS
jgi:hypothetical protein